MLEFREYEEAKIEFPPTYRYANNVFDPEVSGWVDRIWFSGVNSSIKCESYGIVDELRHEHVPVVGRYCVSIKKVNEEMQEKVGKSILSSESVKNQMQ